MKRINNYILEKFKISKDIKNLSDSDINTGISIITDICGIYLDQQPDLVSDVENWIKENCIADILSEVKIYWIKKFTYSKAHFINRIINGEWEPHLNDNEKYCNEVASSVTELKENDNKWEIYTAKKYNNALVFIKNFKDDKQKIIYVFEPKK